MSEWISVEDRLPTKPGCYVAANINGGVWIYIYLCKENKWFESDDGSILENREEKITHWMPLPEPPESV